MKAGKPQSHRPRTVPTLEQQTSGLQKAGYGVAEWAIAAGISKAHLYNLPGALWPESVLIGTRRVIFETPQSWLARMAARGGVQIPQREAA